MFFLFFSRTPMIFSLYLHSGHCLPTITCVTYRPPGRAGTVSSDVVARSSILTGAALLTMRPVTTGGAALSTAVTTHKSRVKCFRHKPCSLHQQRMLRQTANIFSQTHRRECRIRNKHDADTHKTPEYPGAQMHSPVSWLQVAPLRHWQGSWHALP